MLLVITFLRKSHAFATFSLIANYFLIVAGAYFFLMQMHDYAHTTHPEEFVVATPVTEQTAKNKQHAQRQDTISIVISARGDKEYKFHFVQGATLEYT